MLKHVLLIITLLSQILSTLKELLFFVKALWRWLEPMVNRIDPALLNELIHTLLDYLKRRLQDSPDQQPGPIAEYYDQNGTKQLYDERQLMTISQATRLLKISRFKLDDMRATGKLCTLKKDPNDREVRLLRSEVEAARVWYSIPKGKV
ncbi:hypothetical protein SAMN05216436_105131 [bacterium A37T11]|nr:hypothetical protein SAMN05216436_105131 [bacterium A37T11]